MPRPPSPYALSTTSPHPYVPPFTMFLTEFGVADVAVGSYLNYVPLFFPNADLSRTPNIAKYMLACAERPAFERAFGAQHAGLVQAKARGWLDSGPSTSAGDNFFSKLGIK